MPYVPQEFLLRSYHHSVKRHRNGFLGQPRCGMAYSIRRGVYPVIILKLRGFSAESTFYLLPNTSC